MHTASSAMPTCFRLRSTVECTATVLMPMVWQARSTRSAISPRLAMRTLASIVLRRSEGKDGDRGPGTGDSKPDRSPQSGRCHTHGPKLASLARRLFRPVPGPWSLVPASSANHEQRLIELDRFAVLGDDGEYRAGD